MSRRGEVSRVRRSFVVINKVLEKHIDQINPDNNSLPLDGLHWLISINQDVKDFISHIDDYDSYDPG
jgi:hypothetical protein